MESVSDKVIEKIKKEKIYPTPRWHFLLKNYVLWSGFFLSVIFGSLAISLIIHYSRENDWDIYPYLGEGNLQFIAESIPYLWIMFMLAFVGVAYYNCRHTQSGYRYRAYYILLSSLFLSFIFGYAGYAMGIGKDIDDILSDKTNCNCGMAARQKMIWSQPDKGLLSGRIIEVRMDENFNLEDFDGNIWEVRDGEMGWEEVILRNIIIRPDELVKIIGQREGEAIFIAQEIRPWMKAPKKNPPKAPSPMNGEDWPE
jgi:hypothetical protein